MCLQNFNLRCTLFFLFCCVCFATQAQPGDKGSATKKPAISAAGFNDFIKDDKRNGDVETKLDSLRQMSSVTDTDSLSLAYRKAELQYGLEAFDHRHRVFEWQLSSSKYIFIMVNIIVLVGLLLSVWQFYLPIYKMNKQMKQNAVSKEVSHTVVNDENKEVQVSTLKLGKDGVEITSPVIGLLILVISIAFFFLYIHYVYPVSEISHP